jgi:hypothetical protein
MDRCRRSGNPLCPRFGIGGYAANSSLRTFDVSMACHERAFGLPPGERKASRMVSPEEIELLEGNSANLLMARRFWF